MIPVYYLRLVDNDNCRIVKRSRFESTDFDNAVNHLKDYNKDLKNSHWILCCYWN